MKNLSATLLGNRDREQYRDVSSNGETGSKHETASDASQRRISVHYWASARAAAGTAADEITTGVPLSLVEIRERAVALHPGTRLGDVLAVCAVLVGDEPASSSDPATVMVAVGSTVEFLPPFAGG